MSRVEALRRIAADKEVEIAGLQAELAAARAFLESLRRSIAELEERGESREANGEASAAGEVVSVRRLIREAASPLFVDEILRGLGRPITRDSRAELRALLRPWVRRGEVFTRPRPSTFGLVELKNAARPAPWRRG